MATQALARLVVPFQFKAAQNPDTGAHTFEGLAAVWTQDLGNDVIKRGAFKNTLDAWAKSSDAIPLLNSHDHYNVMSALGQLIAAKETKDGLWTQWEVLPGAEGDALVARMTPSKTTGRPIVGKMSIGYEPVKFSYEQPEGSTGFFDRIRNLEEVSLKEVSVVLFPMAPGASIDASTVKMFMTETKHVDPTTLSIDTKMELRKLASRIGLLLKKGPTTPKAVVQDGDGDDDEADQNEVDEPTPLIKPKEVTQDADGDDDEADPPKKKKPKKPAAATADEEATTPPAVVAGKDEKEAAAPSIYPFSEALAQRLQKVQLQHRISDMK